MGRKERGGKEKKREGRRENGKKEKGKDKKCFVVVGGGVFVCFFPAYIFKLAAAASVVNTIITLCLFSLTN